MGERERVDGKKGLGGTERDTHLTGSATGQRGGRESCGCKGENREGVRKDWMYNIMHE